LIEIEEFTKKLSEKTPTPGGGSVLGVLSALGVSLISMSLRFSIKEDSEKTLEIRELLKFLNKKRIFFLRYIRKDQISYLKKDDFKSASVVLKELLESIEETAKKLKNIFKILNKNLISDFYLGLKLLEFSFKGAVLILKENYIFTKKRKTFIKNLIKKFDKKNIFDFKEIDKFLEKRYGNFIRGKKI